MSVVIPSGSKCLEPGPLASTDLLLHRHSLQNLVLEGCPQEKDNDLRFLDGQREEVDLLQELDLHVLANGWAVGDWSDCVHWETTIRFPQTQLPGDFSTACRIPTAQLPNPHRSG